MDVSEPFSVLRSVRQGDSLSPLLYVLSIEPFANNIRNNPDIKGLKLPGVNMESKISQYADDASFILTTLESIRLVLAECKIYGTASGALLNLDKSCGTWLGAWKLRQDKPYGISWVTVKKLLGIHMGPGSSSPMNWGPILKRFTAALNDNQYRNSSMYGRATIANILASSKLYYVASHMPLPKDYEVQFTRTIFKYVWGGQHEAIKRETLYADPLEGGLGIVSPRVKCQALLIRHIFTFLHLGKDGYFPKWGYFTIYWIGFNLRSIRPEYGSNLIPHCLQFRPPFYKKALELFKAYERLLIEPPLR